MQRYWFIVTFVLALTASGQASACFVRADLDLDYVRQADAVVVGRVSNYRRVPERELPGPEGPLPAHARFDVEVAEVLAGNAPAHFSIVWINSTFEEPSGLSSDPLLIAAEKIEAPWPPAFRWQGLMTVLQEPCAPAFLFEVSSEEAKAVRQILRTRMP